MVNLMLVDLMLEITHRFNHVKRLNKFERFDCLFFRDIWRAETTPYPHRDLTCDIVTPTGKSR
jgi:hypothetical protein